jgi:hypothetical protein
VIPRHRVNTLEHRWNSNPFALITPTRHPLARCREMHDSRNRRYDDLTVDAQVLREERGVLCVLVSVAS